MYIIYTSGSVERYWNFTDDTVPFVIYCGKAKV